MCLGLKNWSMLRILERFAQPTFRRRSRPRRAKARKPCLRGGAVAVPEEHQMADNAKPNEKQPDEKPEGKYHYNRATIP